MKRIVLVLAVACALMACDAYSCISGADDQGRDSTSPETHPRAGATDSDHSQSPTLANSDCMTTGSLDERISCVGNSSRQSIQDCDGASENRCSRYLELGKIERALEANEQALIAASQNQNRETEQYQPGYLDQLSTASSEAFQTWRAYRNAMCKANAYYDGISVSSMEDAIIACRINENRKRIEKIDVAVKKVEKRSS